ncbi:MAG: lectin like domain-containing protein [Actinobacteria bacterium]|nr:lectin like domain-containing protein [Actinomycetota bacterium]
MDGLPHAYATLRRLVVALVVALCVALPGAAPVGASRSDTGPAGIMPWETASPYPAYYDLRDHGKVTPVRSQEAYSTCWIHSAMASLESCLLPGALFDFSENNLADHMGSVLDFEGRSDALLSTAYFARWDGPVLERDDPYPRKGRSPEGLRPLRHVQEVLYLPDRTSPLDNDALKWAVSTYGAVDTAMAFEAGFNNSATNAYCSTKAGLVLDHRVTCVGWDDGFPASRFKETPPGDGAFLIKNSWGTDWGDAGYFWISYYDANYGQEMAVFSGAESVSNYDAIYQYDALGWSRSLGTGSDTAWFASRFHCAGSGTIRAVSFYTAAMGSSYEVRVAGHVADVGAAPVVAAGAITLAGYHTVRLETPVAVTNGDVFVVAVRLTSPGRDDPIPLEARAGLISPWAARGQSYISSDGASWDDLVTLTGFADADVCLKAFVGASSGRDVGAPKARVWSAQARVRGTVQVRYGLSDPAFSCASAVLTIALLRADGKVLARTRVPALQVGEQGVWSFPSHLQAGKYTLVARAFDVAGNKQGGATRASLRVAASKAPAGLPVRR